MKTGNSELITEQVAGLVHRVQLPAEASREQPAPVVVMLHGYGGDEDVMWVFRRAIPRQAAIITPRAIHAAPEGGYYWFEHQGAYRVTPQPASLRHVLTSLHHFLTQLPDHYPVDLNRVVMLGFSQGAAMTNSVALVYPDLLFAVVSMAGAMPDIPEIAPYPDLLVDLPVFIANGRRDETVPLRMAHHLRESYQQLGADVTYGEYNVGHKMSLDAIRDLQRWLQKLLPD